jgi:dihydroorotate dehydrogenase
MQPLHPKLRFCIDFTAIPIDLWPKATGSLHYLSSHPIMYHILRRFLFLFDAEWVHHFSMNCLKLICSVRPLANLVRRAYSPAPDPAIQIILFGLNFRNPVGLAAGFDKNAQYLRELECLGFGFVEIGTVTPLPQEGNEKPRLFRLPADKALINRMGFNNEGVAAVAAGLRKWRSAYTGSLNPDKAGLIIGGNIGKNKLTPNEDAWKDYETCFMGLFDHVDYFVINVSSPNTPGLRELQEKEALSKILTRLQSINKQKTHPKPLLLKISPDLSQEQLDQVIDLVLEIQLDGIVATNTSISRDGLSPESRILSDRYGSGGLSGEPLKHKSTEVLRHISKRTKGRIPIIASGGIFNAADAKEKLQAGAALVQVWTGFIYEGPGIAKKICRGIGHGRK